VIGAAKAGTSSIHEYLSEHPQVFMPPVKPNYFGFDGEGSLGDFAIQTFEDYAALYEGAEGADALAIGDVSENCLNSLGAAERIAERLPDARLIAVLRNPVDRAFSGYLMQLRNGRVQAEATEAFRNDAVFVQGGFYFERLKRFYDRFPREQIQVHLFDDFSANTLGVMQDMFEFVGVDRSFRPAVEVRHNVGYAPRSKALSAFTQRRDVRRAAKRFIPTAARPLARRVLKFNAAPAPSVPPTLRAEMEQLYRDDILRVQELVQRDLTHWTGARSAATAG
jgi:hypothetical protein